MEGTALLPALLASAHISPNHAIWLVLKPSIQLEHYRRRPWVKEMVSGCSDAKQAFDNWMERDIRFARWVANQTANYGYRAIWVDGRRTIEHTAQTVAEHFRFRH